MKLSTLFSAYTKVGTEMFTNPPFTLSWMRRMRQWVRLNVAIKRRIAALEAVRHG